MYNLTQCPFCEGDVGSYWPTVNVRRCFSCDLLFRNPLPSQKELTALYEESWSDPMENTSETGGTHLDLARVYARMLASSLALKDFSGLKILEFGAGRGAMLTALSELGADAYGIEPFGNEYLKKQGFNIFRSLDELPQGSTFDGVVSIDVVEHLPTPWNEIKRCRDFLTPSGWLYIATLNSQGLNARVYRSKWREVVKRGHLMFFTPRSLASILAACGYERCRRLRWFVQYDNSKAHTSLHYVLQALYLDGELRYLAFKL